VKKDIAEAFALPPEWVVKDTRDTGYSWHLVQYLREHRAITPEMYELLADILDGTLKVKHYHAVMIPNPRGKGKKPMDLRQAGLVNWRADVKQWLKGIGPPELVKGYQALADARKIPYTRATSATELCADICGMTAKAFEDRLYRAPNRVKKQKSRHRFFRDEHPGDAEDRTPDSSRRASR
jgi:hypothetical protein